MQQAELCIFVAKLQKGLCYILHIVFYHSNASVIVRLTCIINKLLTYIHTYLLTYLLTYISSLLSVYHRCVAGVVWSSEDCVDLAQRISAGMSTTFVGLYCHEGQVYWASDAAEVQKIGGEVAERILNVADRFFGRHLVVFVSYLCHF